MLARREARLEQLDQRFPLVLFQEPLADVQHAHGRKSIGLRKPVVNRLGAHEQRPKHVARVLAHLRVFRAAVLELDAGSARTDGVSFRRRQRLRAKAVRWQRHRVPDAARNPVGDHRVGVRRWPFEHLGKRFRQMLARPRQVGQRRVVLRDRGQCGVLNLRHFVHVAFSPAVRIQRPALFVFAADGVAGSDCRDRCDTTTWWRVRRASIHSRPVAGERSTSGQAQRDALYLRWAQLPCRGARPQGTKRPGIRVVRCCVRRNTARFTTSWEPQ